jgi:5-formyltetrahydrofolate cyclo-ligase
MPGPGPDVSPDPRGDLRRRMRTLLAAIEPHDLAERSQRAADNLVRAALLDAPPSAPRARPRAVMLFAPLLRADGSREIQTLPIAREAWRRGVTVTLPRVDWDARRLTPAIVHDYDHLVTGRHGVLEPAPDLTDFPPEDLDLIVVPGLAFDRRGHRLGHGVGFYDRFLAPLASPAAGKAGLDRPAPTFAGLALAAQVVETLPEAPHDVPMHVVVTEDEVFLPSSRLA